MNKKIFLFLLAAVLFNPPLVLAQNSNLPITTNNNSAAAGASNLPQYNRGVDTSIQAFLCAPSGDGNDLARCINRVYRFGVAFGAIALVFFLVWAGYMYMLGGETQKAKAKGMIQNSFLGMGLLLGSYVLLRFINPNLVTFKPIQPPIFTAELPDCGQLGFGEGCVIADGHNLFFDTSKGSLGPCKAGFKSEAEARAEMETFQVDTWAKSGAQKVSKKRSVTVQKCIAQKTKAAFAAMYTNPEKFPINTLESFNFRLATGSSAKLSAHGMGLAIDINDNENYFICNSCNPRTVGSFWKPCPASGCSEYSMPASGSVVTAFKSQGFGWGGNWKSLKDYMHFSCYPNEQGKCF